MIRLFGPEIIGALLSVIIQAYLAPYMELGFAVPCITLSYAVAYTLASKRPSVFVMPFLLGLITDLLGTGPLGAFALLFLVSAYIASRLNLVFSNGTPVVPILSTIFVIFLVNFLYPALCIACGWDVSFGEAFVFRTLPLWLYDTVIALLLYPFLRFILASRSEDELQVTSLV